MEPDQANILKCWHIASKIGRSLLSTEFTGHRDHVFFRTRSRFTVVRCPYRFHTLHLIADLDFLSIRCDLSVASTGNIWSLLPLPARR